MVLKSLGNTPRNGSLDKDTNQLELFWLQEKSSQKKVKTEINIRRLNLVENWKNYRNKEKVGYVNETLQKSTYMK